MVKHYHGDDSDLKLLMGAVTAAFESVTVEEYDASGRGLLRRRPSHPTLKRPVPGLRLRADGRAAALPGGERVHHLHRLRRRPGLHAPGRRRALRDSAGAGHRQRPRPHLSAEGGSARAALQGGDGLLRRRAREAGPDLEPDRSTADPRRRQLQRRRADARPTPAPTAPGAAAADPARRRRAGVRLHRRGRAGAGDAPSSRIGPW